MSLTIEQHKAIAIDLFNETWDLIDKKDKTVDEELEMIRKAHASRYHWGHAGDFINWSRGDWQLSRVYAELKDGENALKYALSNERIHAKYELDGFDAAFVHEALARSYSILEKNDLKNFHLGKATALAQKINKEEDRKYVLSELETII